MHEDGLPLGGSLHHVRFTRAEGTFGAQDRERAGLLAKRLGVTVELAGLRPYGMDGPGHAVPAPCRLVMGRRNGPGEVTLGSPAFLQHSRDW